MTSLEIKRKPLYVRELPPALETKFIPMDLFAGSHSNYENNDLIKYCIEVFGEEEVVAMIEKYKVGTSSKGHMVYWYLTQYNEVCTGKIMKYVPGKGSRDRESNWSIDWVHRYVEGMTKENVKDVLYGRHLVQPSYLKPGTLIKVVESEASAMIMSIFEPNDVWIATGGQSGLKLDLFDFEGFHVVLYPDADATADWRDKMSSLQMYCPNLTFELNDLCEYYNKKHPEFKDGKCDIKDIYMEEERSFENDYDI